MQLARRMTQFVISMMLLLLASFSMMHLIPGDPVRAALGPTAPSGLVAERRAQLGLDDPIHNQFISYLAGLLHGDFGTSFVSAQPVGEIIGARLGSTLELAVLATAVALLLAVPTGILVAIRTENGRHHGSELAFTSVTGGLAAIPEYVFGVGLIALLAVQLAWLPPAGKDGLSSYLLPVTVLALGPAATLARLVRVEALRELGKDYIRMARAKRLPAWRIHLRHLLPNALTSTLTVGGLLLSSLIAGTVIVENIFAWPGLGTRIVESIIDKDYPVAQGVILVYGGIVLLVNLGIDLTLGIIDPRSTLKDA